MSQPYEPANELEVAFIQAASNQEARPEFYKKLVESTLFVLSPKPLGDEAEKVVGPGDKIEIVHWSNADQSIIPIFTSVDRMSEAIETAGGEELGFIGIPGRDLFAMLSGGNLNGVLNPNTPLGKELLIEEMRALAEGNFLPSQPQPQPQPQAQAEPASEPRQVMLGQPTQYPHKLTDRLRSLFETEDRIDAAHLAIMQDPQQEKPILLIAVKMRGEPGDIFQRAGALAVEIIGTEQPLQFVWLTPELPTGLEPYFSTDVPFYRRPLVTSSGEERPAPEPEKPETEQVAEPKPEEPKGWMGKLKKSIGL